tara:strand:+ start:141 stop:2771 length:2631 start_codon:yes stop_codon:yes gene_type:complete
MFNVLRNNNLLQNDELRFISLNNNYTNKMYLYILLSLFKHKLSNFNQNELNEISKNYKQELNKHVKKKYKINYLNLNSDKHLNILSNLLNINLKFFYKNFKNIKFQSQTSYKSTLYFLIKNKNSYLIAKKNKNSFTYKLNNNILRNLKIPKTLKGGIGERPTPVSNIGLWDPALITSNIPTYGAFLEQPYYENDANWYSIEEVNKFLKARCDDILTGSKMIANKAITEIYTAAFTNYYRINIYTIIHNINTKFEDFVQRNNDGSLYNVKLVISGGDCFNHLISPENRPVSPDIDVKLVISSQFGHNLHYNYENGVYDYPDKENDILLFNLILLMVRNALHEYLLEEIEILNNSNFNNFTGIAESLYNYCEGMMGKKIESLEYKSQKIISKFQRRFNHMEAGYGNVKKLDDPFKINNVLLYSIDCIYQGENESSYTGIPGILDIVISLPTHSGYMIVDYYSNEYIKSDYNRLQQYGKWAELYIMSKEYYIKKDNIKMVKYGLRTENKKILKDFTRLTILLGESYELRQNLGDTINYMLDTIIDLSNNKNFQEKSDKDTLEYLRNFISCSYTRGGASESYYDTCDFNTFKENIKELDISFDLDDSNDNYFGEEKEKGLFRTISDYIFGGTIDNIDNIVVCYKVPKALYFMISDKIEQFQVFNDLESLVNKRKKIQYLAPITNLNDQTEGQGSSINKINYEKLTELTKGNPRKRTSNLKNSLNEAFNSSALYRFNNINFRQWAINPSGRVLPKFQIVSDLLTDLNEQLNRNDNFIRKLYYFDINEDIINERSSTPNFNEYEKMINMEVAKCLLHTFMYAFHPNFIQQDNIYQRFPATDNNHLLDPFHKFYNTIVRISEGRPYYGYLVPEEFTIPISPLR